MKVINFKTEELDGFYLSGETVFFSYRRVYDLCRSNNSGYFFAERKGAYKAYGLPYTLRGRFHTLTETSATKFIEQ